MVSELHQGCGEMGNPTLPCAFWGGEWAHVDADGYKGTPDSQHMSGPPSPPRVQEGFGQGQEDWWL